MATMRNNRCKVITVAVFTVTSLVLAYQVYATGNSFAYLLLVLSGACHMTALLGYPWMSTSQVYCLYARGKSFLMVASFFFSTLDFYSGSHTTTSSDPHRGFIPWLVNFCKSHIRMRYLLTLDTCVAYVCYYDARLRAAAVAHRD